MKKVFLCLLCFFTVIPITFASTNTGFSVNGNYYDNFIDAFNNTKDGSILKMFRNVDLEKGIVINKNIEIDLNGNEITAPTSVFEINGGSLKLSGKGIIRETNPNYGAIKLIGSKTPTGKDYSTVYVEKNVKLIGWSGIFISHENKKSYGVKVELEGAIEAINDLEGGTGIGVYINGNIIDKEEHPIVNIKDGATINSTGDGLYIAGYSTVNIGKANIKGSEAGIGIKAGKLNIDGATIYSDGIDYTPTEGYSNGIKASGTAIQIESHTGYAGNIKLNIENGTFKSKNSHVLYEYIGKGNNTTVETISIKNGSFLSETGKDTLMFSKEFETNHKGFITGGKYSSDITEFLAKGYTINKENNEFIVADSLSTFKEINNKNKNIYLLLLIPISIIIILLYKKRKVTTM